MVTITPLDVLLLLQKNLGPYFGATFLTLNRPSFGQSYRGGGVGVRPRLDRGRSSSDG